MAPRLHLQTLLMLGLAGALFAQSPQPPPAGNPRIYILLKPTVTEPGAARDAFAQRMAALGAVNLQFVSGANAARCEAPATAQAGILSDADVSAVLPIDGNPSATSAVQAPVPAPVLLPPPPPPPPPQGAVFTPPYIPPQQPVPISAGVPMGGGMNAGMAMLTDFAGSMVVRLLSAGSTCKIRLHGRAPAIPASGGAGAFEVKASGNCAWQAVSTADWLQVKTEANTSGTVAVVYKAAGISGGHRQAVIVIQPVAGMAPLKGHTVILVDQQ
jgi:hypothetical protein